MILEIIAVIFIVGMMIGLPFFLLRAVPLEPRVRNISDDTVSIAPLKWIKKTHETDNTLVVIYTARGYNGVEYNIYLPSRYNTYLIVQSHNRKMDNTSIIWTDDGTLHNPLDYAMSFCEELYLSDVEEYYGNDIHVYLAS